MPVYSIKISRKCNSFIQGSSKGLCGLIESQVLMAIMKPLLNLLLLLMISAFTSGDKCTEYNPIPDIHRRDAAYQLSNGETPINDRDIHEAWYGDVAFKLLDEAPGYGKCGGRYPMWMKNTDGKRAIICVQDQYENCSRPFGIEMKTCVGYEVYFLSEAPIHRTSYCFVNNPGAPPVFNVTPSITVDLEHELYLSKLLFRCNINRSSEDLFYKTIWFVGGFPVHTFEPGLWTVDYIANNTLTEDILLGYGFKAGINVQCAVRAQYNLNGAFSESGLSEIQFVGVKIYHGNQYEIAEGETRQLYMQMTVPFGCGTFDTAACLFNVDVLTVENADDCDSAEVVPNSCGIDPFQAHVWQELSSLTFVGKVTSSYGETVGTTHLKLKTQSDNPAFSEFWEDYDIGHVAVKVNKNTSAINYKFCVIRNDPYLYTFDSTNWDGHEVDVGVFVLYKDNSSGIEVQVETEVCNPEDLWWGSNPHCTCGIAVRAGRTVFEISHCDTPAWQIGYTACGDGGDVMIVRRGWDSYQITLPTGTVIGVYINTLDVNYLNAVIYPTPLDEGKTRGLCGVLSDNSDDDMTMSNGQIANNLEDFLGSWRITKKESLFDPEVIENGFLSFKPVYQYCTCNESTADKQITCSAMAALKVCKNPDGMEEVQPRDCNIAKRKKRMAQPIHRRFRRATTEHTWRNGWNESAATAFCESKFNDSESVQLVRDVPGVDVDSPLSDCIADIKASGTTLFTEAAVASVGIKAQREALVNPVLSEPDPANPSAPSLFDVITQQVCPGDCSGRGTCSAGRCRCDPGYEGGDCSVDVTTPPQLVHVADDGHCDLASKECLHTEVLGDIFSGGKDSMCLVEKQVIQPSGAREGVSTSSSNSEFESIGEVFCTLPELFDDEVVVSFNISVSHAGDIYSNELSVFVYDSSCVNVDHSTGKWTLEAGFCVYKGRCASVDSLRQDDPCMRCVEGGEGPFWKKLSENGCSDGNLALGDSSGSTVSGAQYHVTSFLVLCRVFL